MLWVSKAEGSLAVRVVRAVVEMGGSAVAAVVEMRASEAVTVVVPGQLANWPALVLI